MENEIQIKIEGYLDKQWETIFEGMKISYDIDNTILTGKVKDEAQKFGILNTIGDYNLKLISIEPFTKKENKNI